MMHQYVQKFTSRKVQKTGISNRQVFNRDNEKTLIPGNSVSGLRLTIYHL